MYVSTFNEDEIHPDKKNYFKDSDIKLNEILSSDNNDKCPYIFNDKKVFASDRDGGYGGYDLYYSAYRNGIWTLPKNLGDKINSAFDEYRPIITPFYEFDDTMLIFSSNRSGGKGGFDLFAVRTNKIAN